MEVEVFSRLASRVWWVACFLLLLVTSDMAFRRSYRWYVLLPSYLARTPPDPLELKRYLTSLSSHPQLSDRGVAFAALSVYRFSCRSSGKLPSGISDVAFARLRSVCNHIARRVP
ncbi:hypothetical protein BDQ17DRAFT_156032 [Cyathus striatus]|nr:hypothetical protein BDQ17DRAFT_156032 [Cyathus striatus]